MDASGISTAILSITVPGLDFGDLQEVARQAREADGVELFANSRGVYLGEPASEPLFAELNRRRAVVFIHPNQLPGPKVPGLKYVAADILLDTTRAATLLVTSGFMARYPNMSVILSHAGGYIPYQAVRICRASAPSAAYPGAAAADMVADMRRYYFDTTLSGNEYTLKGLLAFANASRITFGSDFLFGNASLMDASTKGLDAFFGGGQKTLDETDGVPGGTWNVQVVLREMH
ncbi:hypothetical protein WJX75_007468 [Coccomyxa subellipsoidea]|uniref:Amidohydrolase-related domain-containing protein n=1 Tax=Coccomyxa subellipsoidea TaxID=248742 RepID=A0ABR2YTX8_9CHLO